MSEMKATIKGKMLVLEIPMDTPRPSNSGKMNLHFTSGGFKQITTDGLRANITIGKYPPRAA